MKFYWVIIVQCIVLFSCVEHKDNLNEIIIPIESNSKIDDFIDKFEMVNLETTDECLIGEITKICLDNGYYYITDKQSETVFVFDDLGHYVSQISKRGNGPSEYIDLTDFDVRDSKVYILSTPNKQIFIYDRLGNCLNTVRLNDWYHHLAVDENCIILHSGKSNNQFNNIISIDFEGHILNSSLPFKDNNSFRFKVSPFNEVGISEYLLTFPYDNRVAVWKDNQCKYKYRLVFDTQVKLTDNEMETLTYDEIKKIVQYKNSLYRIDSIVNMDDDNLFMVVSIFYEQEGLRQALCKVDLTTGSSKFYKLGEEVDLNYPYISNLINIEEGKIYSVILPYFKYNVDKNIGNKLTEEINEEANPIICIYTIK